MSDNIVKCQTVWKKFRKGERFDSLRDLIPAITRRVFSKTGTTLESREFWALRDLSFELRRGDSLGIMGPNGSGKSTTLKLLSRILKPDSGSLSVNGRFGALIELGAGFHPDLTGRENIYLNGTILGMKRAEIAKKFDEIVAFSELEEFLDTPVKRYSSGMYARLGFSVAAHMDPELLIVDEVLSVGDYHFQEKCFSKMKQFTERGVTLVFVSHNLTAIGTLCANALLLHKGQTIFQGDTSTAIRKYYSLYEEDADNSHLEVVESRLLDRKGQERDVFQPGEPVTLEVTFKARTEIEGAHAGLVIRTGNGQFVFDTATSRLCPNRIDLAPGQCMRVVFKLDLNLRGDVFLIGITVTPESGEVFLYFNGQLKRIVMTADSKGTGFVNMNPRAELIMGTAGESTASAASVQALH